jgi:hypothetical protein
MSGAVKIPMSPINVLGSMPKMINGRLIMDSK